MIFFEKILLFSTGDVFTKNTIFILSPFDLCIVINSIDSLSLFILFAFSSISSDSSFIIKLSKVEIRDCMFCSL